MEQRLLAHIERVATDVRGTSGAFDARLRTIETDMAVLRDRNDRNGGTTVELVTLEVFRELRDDFRAWRKTAEDDRAALRAQVNRWRGGMAAGLAAVGIFSALARWVF